MKITFVARDNKGAERYKIFDLNNKESNPFSAITPEGEKIDSKTLATLISSGAFTREISFREIRHFCLDAIIDGYLDIRYY